MKNKFEVGDKVKILWHKTIYINHNYDNHGYIKSVDKGRGLCAVEGFNIGDPEFHLNFEHSWLKLFVDNRVKDNDIVEQTLKRNEPMKVTQTSNEQDFSLFDCPNCGTTMYYVNDLEDFKFCIECGQKLDWGYE